MNSDVTGSTLLDALNGLESIARTLHRAAQHQYEPRLERLQHAVESLGLTTTARPPRGSDEYLRDWQRYLADPRQRLTPARLALSVLGIEMWRQRVVFRIVWIRVQEI